VSALDVSIQAQVIKICLRNLQQKFGLAYLFIATICRSSSIFSKRVAVMFSGASSKPRQPASSIPRRYTPTLKRCVGGPDFPIQK